MMTTQKEAEKAAPTGLLAGKVCIVSGVGPGLGRQAAHTLATPTGRHLLLAARRQPSLDEVAAEVGKIGAHAITVPTDIADAEQCARLVERWRQRSSGVSTSSSITPSASMRSRV